MKITERDVYNLADSRFVVYWRKRVIIGLVMWAILVLGAGVISASLSGDAQRVYDLPGGQTLVREGGMMMLDGEELEGVLIPGDGLNAWDYALLVLVIAGAIVFVVFMGKGRKFAMRLRSHWKETGEILPDLANDAPMKIKEKKG